MSVQWACANINLYSVIVSIECGVLGLLRMPHAKKLVPVSFSLLFMAGCIRRTKYASSFRMRRPSRVEKNTFNLILGLSVAFWCWLT